MSCECDDLRELGASVMLIGENLPRDAGDLVCQPNAPPGWQFVIDGPTGSARGRTVVEAVGRGLRLVSDLLLVVEDEHGLLGKKAEASPNAD